MTCAACGHENRAGRKFCAECGAPLALACATCGAPYEAGEKFCGECGASLASAHRQSASAESAKTSRAAGEASARKIVTIVFADLVGSTSLHERLDAESAQRVMGRYYAALSAAVDAQGGTVVKLLGDGVMAAFGLRRVAEDDGLRAVRAAVAMQEAFRELIASQPALAAAGLRVAVNTGEVVVTGALDDVIGDPVNVAARLQEQGKDGDVVVGEATRRLVATRVTLTPLGSVTLKGRAEAVAAYRVESLEPPAGVTAAPFVGREDEVGRLTTVYDAAVKAPSARLAVLLGSPGLGKSRLIEELGRRLGDEVTLLTGHCDAAGGATFAPIAAALSAVLRVDAAAGLEAARASVEAALSSVDTTERARIADGVAALLSSSPAAPEETFFVVRRLLAALARERPVVLVIDDVHWAEPLLLDLVEHLIQWGSGVPLYLLVAARPELRDLRSSLVTPGGLVSEVVTLGGLDAGAAMRLAASVIGASDLPAAVAAKVLATSEGNPLFVGELVRMLVQEGALAKEGGRWTASAGLAAIEMPPTIHALLAARIERLKPEERTVLERAAVVGRHFSRSAVAALLGSNGAELDARLEALRRSELIERDPGWLLGEPALRFHHVLIRDAAYRRLLKGTRAELHERLADWIEARIGDTAEHDETIGRHLEQAHQLLSELGTVDARGKTLGERAAQRLAAAGRRALARDDVRLAAALLGRSIERLDADAGARAELALDWCEALLSASDVAPASRAIAELERFAKDSERLRGWHTCFAAQLAVMTAPEELHAAADRVAAAARDLAKLDDAAGEAKAHFVHAQALARLGKVGAGEAALDHALAAARRAGDRRRANAVLAGAPLAALWGPSPVTRASGRCLDVVRVLRITQGAPAVEAVALSCQGVLEALRGRTDAARRMLASSRTMVEELGITQRLYEVDAFIGRVDLLEGDPVAAEQKLWAAYHGLRDLGLGSDAARAAALLGRALLAQGRAGEAEKLSYESEQLAGDDLQAAIAWRGVRAEALAARGEHDAAITLAKAAVEIAAATDALLDHADARVALAVALNAAGRGADADTESRRATELWHAKGATLLAENVTSFSARPAPVTAPPAPDAGRARRLRWNAAAAATERFGAAVSSRDEQALANMFSAALEVIDHQNGVTYGRDGHLESLARLLRMRDARLSVEPLATLGERLVLWRRRIRAKGNDGVRYDVGEVDREEIVLFELNDDAAVERVEVFAAAHLADAIVRLYTCYAEQLPDGPERERAAITARAAAFMMTRVQEPDFSELYSPSYQDIDHRSVGYGALSREESVRVVGAFDAVADGVRFRIDDVLVLSPSGLLRKTTTSGAWRDGGGPFERTVWTLNLFGSDGRVTRQEIFDADREAEALARFDELAAGGAPRSVVRRVRPNLATATCEWTRRAIEARDATSVTARFSDDFQETHHPTGATYGRDEALASIERLMRSHDVSYEVVPLATLGSNLVLSRRRIRASGTRGHRFDVGEYENEAISLHEVDAEGRHLYHEVFAKDRLDDALVRLYERYAEGLPEGVERARAATFAASARAMFASDRHRQTTARMIPADAEWIDHRPLPTWSARGPNEIRKHVDALDEVAADVSIDVEDLLAVGSHALLARRVHSGTDRRGGGHYEREFVVLFSGLERLEFFSVDQQVEALARFDEITRAVPRRRRVRENAASRGGDVFATLVAARDAAGLEQHLDESLRLVHHPTGATYGRRGMLTTWRSALKAERVEFRRETLGTLGETLALSRQVTTVEGLAEEHLKAFGPTEVHEISVIETDERGRMLLAELFAADRLGDALVRLYEIHAERSPDERARACAAGIARSLAASNGPVDPDRLAATYAPTSRCVDHRVLGTWTAHERDEFVRHWRTQLDVAPDSAGRYDDVLAFAPRVLLARMTFFGTGGVSGGAFENPILILFTYGADGLMMCGEVFEAEDEAAALARFDALTAEEPQGGRPRRAHRRVRPNAGTAAMERGERAFTSRDLSFVGEFSDKFVEISHPTDTTYGREQALASLEHFLSLAGAEVRHDVLATLGERLCMFRRWMSASAAGRGRFDVGAFEKEEIVVNELDADGKLLAREIFAADRLRSATIRLYERYAESLPEGPERNRAAGIAQTLASIESSMTDTPLGASRHAADFVCVDHRKLATWSSANSEEWHAHWRVQNELGADFRLRDDDILAIEPAALAVRETFSGTSRESGGAIEWVLLVVQAFDAEGAVVRSEIFEPHQEAEALACFDRFVGAPHAVTPARFANVATRTAERIVTCWRARDWDGFARTLAARFRFDDRRATSRLVMDREQYIAFARELGDMTSARLDIAPLATRGERLALIKAGLEVAEGDVGPSEIEYLYLAESRDHRVLQSAVAFDLGDLDAAYAELDARWIAIEAAVYPRTLAYHRRFRRALANHDLEAIAVLHAPTLVARDHRLVGWGVREGPAAFVGVIRAMVDLAPDVQSRVDHIRMTERGLIAEVVWIGTRDGGAFESPFVWVVELDADGRARRLDFYDPHHVDRAFARFDEIRAENAGTADRFANAASEATRSLREAMVAHDWERFERCLAANHHCSDRRRVVQLELDRAQHVAFTRGISDGREIRSSSELIATRGDRLAIKRTISEFSGGDVGPSAIEFVSLTEVDESGRVVGQVRWDPEDLDAAYAELDARWAAGEGATGAALALRRSMEAVARRDWNALITASTPDFFARDHRVLGWGDTLGDIKTLIRSQQALFELAPDTRYRVDHLRVSARAYLRQVAQVGTRDGGAFENLMLQVGEFDENGRGRCIDVYDMDQVDQAWARFAELQADARTTTDPFANAAWGCLERFGRAYAEHDWPALTDVFAESMSFDDRRPLLRLGLELTRDEFLEQHRVLFNVPNSGWTNTLVATRGERLVLARLLFNGHVDGTGGALEIDHLAVLEVDRQADDARMITVVLFAPEDADGAYEELERRFDAGEAAEYGETIRRSVRTHRTFVRNVALRNWEAIPPACAPGFVEHDHRPIVGLGTTRGVEEWVQRNVRTYTDLAPDTVVRWQHLRVGSGAVLWQLAWEGSRDGGRYEIPMVGVTESDEQGRTQRLDIYEPEQVDAALVRFAELCGDAQGVPRNLASAALDRWQAAFEVGFATDTWDAMAAVCAPDMVFDDRRRLALISGGSDLMIASARERARVGARPSRCLRGTAGERIVIENLVWAGGPAGGRFEIEYLGVIEANEAGLISAIVMFDADELGAAQREAAKRWTAIDPDAPKGVTLVRDFVDAFNARDHASLLAVFADDVVVDDRRHAGIGRCDGAEAYADSLEALWTLAPDHQAAGGLVWHAHARYGGVTNVSRAGTLPGGGAFESEYLMVFTSSGEHFTRLEYFELDGLDTALARFRDLRPDPLRIPPNAATRAWDRWEAAIAAGNLEVLKAGYSPTYRFEDRRRLVRTTVDVDGTLRTDSFFVEGGWRPKRRLLATAGDRLVLHHVVWTTGEPGAESEIEALIVDEVNESGRGTAMVVFDADDRAAASAELLERYVAGDDGPPQETVAVMRAWNAHDLEALRTLLPADFYLDDRRRTGVGRLEGADAYLESLRAVWELSPDLRTEALYMIALEPHGAMWVNRWFGTNTEGGEFEAVYVALTPRHDNRSLGLEIFELDDLDAARARFEALGAACTRAAS